MYSHRLHYRWSQLEADRSGLNLGSPIRPVPKAHRVLDLCRGCEYESGSLATSSSVSEQTKFSACAAVYKSIDYNTFCKNGALKLTEVELYFLSSKMSRKTARDWAVVYVGIGTGERFRFLRDEFFPDLTVVAFDPLEGNFSGDRDVTVENAKRWSEDGTNFTFVMRCFTEDECDWIRERTQGKKLLLISDIRGMHFKEGHDKPVETGLDQKFDKDFDNQLQLKAIRILCPESSLVKFAIPDVHTQFYEYLPGVLLKQVFCWYGTGELRLMIDGNPKELVKYNNWEIFEKMQFHHECVRGQVYESARPLEASKCLDHCFDCTVLWDTISAYAKQNDTNADETLLRIINFHIYSPSDDNWNYTWKPPTMEERRNDVQECLRRGNVMQAIAALEVKGKDDDEEIDWTELTPKVSECQAMLGHRLRTSLQRPASRHDLINVLGSLSDPVTLLQSDIVFKLSRYDKTVLLRSMKGETPAKRQRSVWKCGFCYLTESQQKAALALGWTETLWNSNIFVLPKKSSWSSFTQEQRYWLTELGESEQSWDGWAPAALN